VLLSKLIY